MRRVLLTLTAAMLAGVSAPLAGQPQLASSVADRVRGLTRTSNWRLVQSILVGFPTFHPQGMVKIGDTFFVTSVEVTTAPERYPEPRGGYDRSPGVGLGHLFKID